MKDTNSKKLNKKTCAVAVFILLSLGLVAKLGTKMFENAATKLGAENLENKKTDSDKNDTVVVDTVSRPMVQFSNLQQSMYAEFQGFSYVYPNGSRLVWTPFVVLKPTLTIRDNFVLGFTTTQMAQTYTSDKMGMMMHNIFFNAQYKLKNNNTMFATVGQIQAQNYLGPISKNMPTSSYFEMAMIMGSGHTLPSVALVGFKNSQFSVSAGYAEYCSPFTFNGGGDFVVGGEVFLNNMKIGTLWVLNTNKCLGDIQMAYNDGRQIGLLELTKLGDTTCGIHGLYAVHIDSDLIAFGNAYKQFNSTGISGANVGLRHEPTGVYVAFGIAQRENMLRGMEQYDKTIPMLEFGVTKSLMSQK